MSGTCGFAWRSASLLSPLAPPLDVIRTSLLPSHDDFQRCQGSRLLSVVWVCINTHTGPIHTCHGELEVQHCSTTRNKRYDVFL